MASRLALAVMVLVRAGMATSRLFPVISNTLFVAERLASHARAVNSRAPLAPATPQAISPPAMPNERTTPPRWRFVGLLYVTFHTSIGPLPGLRLQSVRWVEKF
jgi:hypothetical protein